MELSLVDEIVAEYGVPEYVECEDGEGWYWQFRGRDLPVGDNLSDILSFAAKNLPAPQVSQPTPKERVPLPTAEAGEPTDE